MLQYSSRESGKVLWLLAVIIGKYWNYLHELLKILISLAGKKSVIKSELYSDTSYCQALPWYNNIGWRESGCKVAGVIVWL